MKSVSFLSVVILLLLGALGLVQAQAFLYPFAAHADGRVTLRNFKARECPPSDHLHVSIGAQNASSITISWSAVVATKTRLPHAPADYSAVAGYTPAVSFGTTPYKIDGVVSGPTLCHQVRYFGDRVHFSCTIKNAQATGRTLYYSAGDIGCVSKLPLAASVAPQPRAGSDVSVAIFGDMGTTQSDGTLVTLKRELLTLNTSTLAIHVGDIAYGDDVNLIGPNPDYEPILDDFMKRIEPIASHVPYMVSPGNHDVTCHIIGDSDCDMGLRNFSAYRHRWNMPSNASGAIGASNLWYAFEYGNVQFISISTESDYPLAPYNPNSGSARAGGFGDQLKWLEVQLQRANEPAARRLRPWIVVYGHRPLYSTSNLDFPFDQPARIRQTFEPLFQKYGVDMYLAGHVHMYERTWPVANEAIVQRNYDFPTAPVYINNGAAGNTEGHCNHYTQDIPAHIPLRNAQQFGIGILRTDSTTTQDTLKLCYDFLPASSNLRLDPVDSICITKHH